MGSNMERSTLYLKLFKLVFGSVSLFAAENEQVPISSNSILAAKFSGHFYITVDQFSFKKYPSKPIFANLYFIQCTKLLSVNYGRN
jgi:hypothetical protein